MNFSVPAQPVAGRIALAAVLGVFCLAFYLPISSKAVNNIFYAGLVFPCLCWLLVRFRQLPLLAPFLWAFGLLLLMVVINAGSLSGVKKALYLSMFLVACMYLSGRSWSLHAPLTIFALLSLCILLYVTVDWMWLSSIKGRWIRYHRFMGEPVNPVYFSLLMVFAFLYLWLFFVADWLEQKSRWLLLPGLFLLSVLVLICATVFQSRTTLLGFMVFLVGYLVYKRLIWLGLVLISGMLVLIFVGDIDQTLMKRGYSYRLDIWQEALLRLFTECNPFWGCGNDFYRFLGKFRHPHSGYLAMLYRNGIIGAAVFGVFAAIYFRHAIRRPSPWLILSLFGWGSLLTTTNGVFTTPQPLWIYFWLPTFMAIIEAQRGAADAYLDSGERVCSKNESTPEAGISLERGA